MSIDPDLYDRVHTWNNQRTFRDRLCFPNFSDLIDARTGDDHLYCTFYAGSRHERGLSHRSFASRSIQISRWLVDVHHLRPGDRVMTVMGNHPATLLIYSAVLYTGATIVPSDPGIDPERFRLVHDDSQPDLLFKEPGVRVGENVPEPVIPVDESWRASISTYPKTPVHDGEKQDFFGTPGLIIYTSGTTGTPKGVVLTQGQLLINAEATQNLHGMDPSHVHMCVLPLHHVNAFDFSFVTTLYAGSKLVLNRFFHPDHFWHPIKEEDVAVVSMTPYLLKQLVDHEGPDFAPPGTFDYFVSAASHLSNNRVASVDRMFDRPVFQAYGLSETVNFSLAVPPDVERTVYEKVTHAPDNPSIGCPVEGNEVAIMNDSGETLPEGETGEIVIRGFNVMEGYLNRSPETKKAFRNGWFHTGDLGFYRNVGDQRYFFHEGRRKDIVKRKGEMVSLKKIDTRLREEPGLSDAYAVGFINAEGEEDIGLYVVSNQDTPDRDEIIEICRNRLSGDMCPSKIILREEPVPRTSTGKLQRYRLKEQFESGS